MEVFEAIGMQKEHKGTAFSADVADEKHHVIHHKRVGKFSDRKLE